MSSQKHKKKSSSSHSFRARLLNGLFKLSLIGVVWLGILIIYSDAEIQSKFSENRWLVPAKVYTRSLTFHSGDRFTIDQLLLELKRLNYRRSVKAAMPGQYEFYGNDLLIHARAFSFAEGALPSRQFRVVIENSQITSAYHLDTAALPSLTPVKLEPVFIGQINPLSNQDREIITLDQVPSALIDALLISEDRSFYDHLGLSLKGIARALGENISEGRIAQGGSTLTQQLVKNYFLTNKKSLWRKLREAIMALLLEVHYSKAEILQAYINEVYLGQQGPRAVHGFASASRFYFDQPLTELSSAQLVTLVALVRGPSYYNPRRFPDRTLERRNLILQQLFEFERINESQLREAKAHTLSVVPKPSRQTRPMPAVLDLVRRELKRHYSSNSLNHDSLAVFTTIDPNVQLAAEVALSSRIEWLETNRSSTVSEAQPLQGAVVITDRQSGSVKAIVGDRNPSYAGFNRALFAYRQTGSAIKPFVYASALKRAAEYSLATPLRDETFTLTASDGSVWQPTNYDKVEHGQVSMVEALTHSYNLSTARLALAVGIENVVADLYRLGFERDLKAFPSLALGAQEMSPWELTQLYQVLASGGLAVETSVVAAVVNPTGQITDRYPATATQALSPEVAFMINHSLQKVATEGTARYLGERLRNFRVAGKTGTTDDLRDSWFAGFSDQYLAVIWLGLDNNQSTGLTGASGALLVWADLIEQVERNALGFYTPSGIEWGAPENGDCLPFVLGMRPPQTMTCEPSH